eukprot:CAMPEP_0170530568 /NCGR_PEP_ID=MMETSP0209-20121228/49665_1 /TAXON_ID=665100 ORGANISM="Litonotus pictus, Strain P1" /NCGR_SAMPLE_ID=MMETSP0209 /ASSEMBLY_ACC=CAM_ASM_000301 /LENGTH=69 /DNA_ID=CAMNT_0010823867 /DNA_START=557 /DNA_END=762 /DNA_ORIENTATION=-
MKFIIDDNKENSDIYAKPNIDVGEFLFDKGLKREDVFINSIDPDSEIKPMNFDGNESTPMGTDGSFYAG